MTTVKAANIFYASDLLSSLADMIKMGCCPDCAGKPALVLDGEEQGDVVLTHEPTCPALNPRPTGHKFVIGDQVSGYHDEALVPGVVIDYNGVGPDGAPFCHLHAGRDEDCPGPFYMVRPHGRGVLLCFAEHELRAECYDTSCDHRRRDVVHVDH